MGNPIVLSKTIFFVLVLIVGVVAYTGIDVTSKYDDVSQMRDNALDGVIDPLTKNILKYASESNLDEIVGSTIAKYGDGV